jgi:hypothetical protein
MRRCVPQGAALSGWLNRERVAGAMFDPHTMPCRAACRLVNSRNLSGFTALSYAAWSGGEAAVRALLQGGADVTVVNEHVFDQVGCARGHIHVCAQIKVAECVCVCVCASVCSCVCACVRAIVHVSCIRTHVLR